MTGTSTLLRLIERMDACDPFESLTVPSNSSVSPAGQLDVLMVMELCALAVTWAFIAIAHDGSGESNILHE